MFSLLLPILKSKLAALGAVLVIALVLVLWGPRVVGYKYRWWCYGLAILIVVGFLLYLLIKKLRAKKNARMLEKFLNQQADDQLLSSRPDVQDELAAIKEKMNRAVGILKKSRIARGRRGAEALYVLPWYMIIGPSASGKSTAIRNSGLHFPPVDPDSEDPGKVKGLGGTRNCDWWFTNEGIILDTAGRYTLSPNVQEDREEWSNFLKMLQKARPRAPINGLILAVSMADLLHQDADGIEAHARAMRSRIDELIVKLQVLYPIYVVFTKCDLVAGFVEFFGDFTKADREQIWGWTRKYEPARRPMREEFEQEFALLSGVLENRRSRQLAGEMRPAQKRGTYLFSVEFAAAGRKLATFVEALFQPNPYQQNPLVRGFYFTSGTQEGTPIAQVMESMQKDFGLVSDFMAQFEPPKETKAYFIKDLFQEIILPDEAKVYPTTKAARRRRAFRIAAMAAQAVVSGLLILAMGTSYVNNCSHNAELAATIKRVADATSSQASPSVSALNTLDELRDELARAGASIPLRLRWGLYSGDVVVRKGLEVYFQRYHDILLEPVAQRLADKLMLPLDRAASNTDVINYYTTFTAYQMLTVPYDSASQATGTLRDQVDSIFQSSMDQESFRQFAQLNEKQLPFYWKYRPDATIRWLRASGSQRVLSFATSQMNSHWTMDLIYNVMISDISSKESEFTYSEAVPASIRLSGKVRVPRAFMAETWQKDVQPAIERMPEVLRADPMKKPAFSMFTDEQIQQRLTQKYVTEFIAVWRQFIQSGMISTFRDLDDANDGLKEFTGDNSPALTVLNKVYEQGNLKDLDKESAKKVEQQFTPLGRFFGLIQASGDPPKKTYNELLGQVAGKLKEVQKKLEGGAHCGDALRDFGRDMREISGNVEKLLNQSDLAQDAAKLLCQPISGAQSAAFLGGCGCLDQAWKARVYDFYNTNLSGMYPFTQTDDGGVDRANMESFFDKFSDFVTSELGGAGGVSVPGGFQDQIEKAQQIQRVLKKGREKLRFSMVADARSMAGIKVLRFKYAGFPDLEYVSGTPYPVEYVWPQVGDARTELSIESTTNGVFFQPLQYSGDWGLFHLIDQAERSGSNLIWTFKARTGQTQKVVLTVTGEGADFILNHRFSQFQCPQSVCR